MEKITDAVMSEKPRYAILDGLRGVADCRRLSFV